MFSKYSPKLVSVNNLLASSSIYWLCLLYPYIPYINISRYSDNVQKFY